MSPAGHCVGQSCDPGPTAAQSLKWIPALHDATVESPPTALIYHASLPRLTNLGEHDRRRSCLVKALLSLLRLGGGENSLTTPGDYWMTADTRAVLPIGGWAATAWNQLGPAIYAERRLVHGGSHSYRRFFIELGQ